MPSLSLSKHRAKTKAARLCPAAHFSSQAGNCHIEAAAFLTKVSLEEVAKKGLKEGVTNVKKAFKGG